MNLPIIKDSSHKKTSISSYALMGASGCGKTTLISCIVGTNSLDSGKVDVFYNKVGTNNTKVGYMPQEMALIPEFTIRESISFYGIIYGMDKYKIDERVHFLCQLLDLQDSDKLVKNCSGGQQRRVSFAVALVHEPDILILDEPTVGVDPLLRFRIWEYLVDLTITKNVTVLMSTHYIEEARKSTHVGLMRNGILLIEDTPQNFLELCDTQSLETAFLHLSEQQEKGLQPPRAITASEMTEEQAKRMSKSKVEYFPPSFGTKLRALIMKSFIQTIRDRG
jgi:ABC-type multidrug transport system ATPase subunit